MQNSSALDDLWLKSEEEKKKKKPAPAKTKTTYENPLEAFKDFGSSTYENVKTNTKAAGVDVFKQVFGGEKPFHKKQGEMQPGQDVDLAALNKKQEANEIKANMRPGIDYIGEVLKVGEKASQKESEETKQQVDQIIAEIKNISRSAKDLEQKVIQATGSAMVKPGTYHKNFLDHVFQILRDAKTKLDSAGSFLSAMRGKQKKGPGMGNKKPKTNYWDMAQQHGSKFTLSGERAVSNQVG